MLFASSSRACQPVVILGESKMSQSDVKLDENRAYHTPATLVGDFRRNLGNLSDEGDLIARLTRLLDE
jgi:hypothetical protein